MNSSAPMSLDQNRFATAAAGGLQQILHNPAIWRAGQLAEARQRRGDSSIPSGFPALDALLPDGGWPTGALCELQLDASGLGELSLLLPALRQLCQQQRGIALLAPPWLPQARVWEAAGIPLARLLLVESSGADLLWSAEQCLRSGECGAVLLWGPAAGRALDQRALQRLQLAAVAGNALCFLFRPCSAAANPSPAPLRLRLSAEQGALRIDCLKRRGASAHSPLLLPLFPAHWHKAAPAPALIRLADSKPPKAQHKTPAMVEQRATASVTAGRPVQLQLCVS
jgi:cell division inhibitor SulA